MSSIQKQFLQFMVRWALNSLGLWIAARLIGSISYSGAISTILIAGFVLSIVNAVLKPILVILSLPMIVLTLGLFMLIINGIAVYITAQLSPGIDMGFGSAILAGMVVGLINYALTHLFDLRTHSKAA